MKKTLSILILTFAFYLSASAQTTEDEPTVTISQSAANQAAVNAREVLALREYKAKADADLKSRDEILATLKIELAKTTGQLTAREAEVARQTAIITALIPMLRRKSIGLINF